MAPFTPALFRPLFALSLATGTLAAGALHAQDTAADLAFRDAVNTPPPGYTGPIFELSHAYPEQDPGKCGEADCPWLYIDVDFSSGEPVDWESGPWKDYIAAIMEVVLRGQDPNLSNELGFQTNVNGETAWFHMPWMAYDPSMGREFAHGTTNERTAHLSDFLGSPMPNATPISGMTEACQARFAHGFESWAVGVYNKWGGYALGQAFPEDGAPALVEQDGQMAPAGLPFPEGTLVTKFLTTNATPDCVPYLADSAVWQVNRHQVSADKEYTCQRGMQTTRLTQVDVAVVDHRSPTRWVYGTFGYSANAPGDTVLERLVPLGLQWGSDPNTFPAVPRADSVPASQSVLNTYVETFEHWGCAGRLAGPVDNPKSSCVSCHTAAFAAADQSSADSGKDIPPVFGFPGLCADGGSPQNAAYFSNYQFPDPYPSGAFPGAIPLDSSLQMAVAFTQHSIFANKGAPTACTDPNQF